MNCEMELIDQIEQIRARNNTHWMDLVRLAMSLAPARTKALLKEIEYCDGEVRRLTKELAEEDDELPNPRPIIK